MTRVKVVAKFFPAMLDALQGLWDQWKEMGVKIIAV
jgi:hypothetical protein